MNKKLHEIFKRNAELEKQVPYNFCDRWCEQCPQETQHRCKLYLEDLDRRVTNIAHGRDDDDIELLQQDIEKKLKAMEPLLEEWEEDEFGEMEDDLVGNAYEDLKETEELLHDHSLQKITHRYMTQMDHFLKGYFKEGRDVPPNFRHDYHALFWYHTLLPVKTHRALCGIYIREEAEEGDDASLCDAVAQFGICKKAVMRSESALRNIMKKNAALKHPATPLLAMLHNIHSQITLIEAEI